jgi:hypothetical protein
VLARLGLAHAQFGMLAATPMNDKYNFTRPVIDVDHDIDDQCA